MLSVIALPPGWEEIGHVLVLAFLNENSSGRGFHKDPACSHREVPTSQGLDPSRPVGPIRYQWLNNRDNGGSHPATADGSGVRGLSGAS